MCTFAAYKCWMCRHFHAPCDSSDYNQKRSSEITPVLWFPASTGQLISADWVKDTSVCCPAIDTEGHQMHCPCADEFINSPVVTGTLSSSGGVRGSAHLWPGQPSLWSLHMKMFSTVMSLFLLAGSQRVTSQTSLWACSAFKAKLRRSVKKEAGERGLVIVQQYWGFVLGQRFKAQALFLFPVDHDYIHERCRQDFSPLL